MKQKTEILFVSCFVIFSLVFVVLFFHQLLFFAKGLLAYSLLVLWAFSLKTKPKKNLDIHPVMLQELESND